MIMHSKLIRTLALVHAIGLTSAACEAERARGTAYKEASDRMLAARAYLEEIRAEPGVQQRMSGLLIKRLEAGDAPTLEREPDIITFHYKASMSDENVFDTSYERNQPVSVPYQNLIAGLKEGLPLIGEGARGIIYIPPQLAYGADGIPSLIPANAALVYEVEVIKIELVPER